MAATNVGDVITLDNTTVNTCASIVADIADSQYARTLLSPSVSASATAGSKCYEFRARFVVNSGAIWTDVNSVILHTYDGSTPAITFNASSSLVQFGYLDDSVANKPVTVFGSTTAANISGACTYSFMSDNSAQTFCSSGGGIFRFYGGMMKFRDDEVSGKTGLLGDNQTYKVQFPDSTRIIQCNVENFGGADFQGQYRIEESTFKSSKNVGIDFLGASTQRLRDIKIMRCDTALNFSGSNNVILKNIRLRGNTDDLEVNGLSGIITLVDSDTISSNGIVSFGSGGVVLEANSYNLTVVDANLNPLQGVRTYVYQKSSQGSVGYGSEEYTDSNGQRSEVIVKRNQYDSTHTSVAGRLEYGNFGVRIRTYGRQFMDIEKVPEEKALRDQFINNLNTFTVASSATASTYTGISVSGSTKELVLTEKHTAQEVYDYLQYYQSQPGELDLPEIFKTKDGVNIIIPDDWDIVGTEFLDLGTSVIINRYVPISILSVAPSATCSVIEDPKGTKTKLGEVVAGAGETDVNITTKYTGSVEISVRARKAGYEPYRTDVIASSTGTIFTANMQEDLVYEVV